MTLKIYDRADGKSRLTDTVPVETVGQAVQQMSQRGQAGDVNRLKPADSHPDTHLMLWLEINPDNLVHIVAPKRPFWGLLDAPHAEHIDAVIGFNRTRVAFKPCPPLPVVLIADGSNAVSNAAPDAFETPRDNPDLACQLYPTENGGTRA